VQHDVVEVVAYGRGCGAISARATIAAKNGNPLCTEFFHRFFEQLYEPGAESNLHLQPWVKRLNRLKERRKRERERDLASEERRRKRAAERQLLTAAPARLEIDERIEKGDDDGGAPPAEEERRAALDDDDDDDDGHVVSAFLTPARCVC
jgi:hypothetical protein